MANGDERLKFLEQLSVPEAPQLPPSPFPTPQGMPSFLPQSGFQAPEVAPVQLPNFDALRSGEGPVPTLIPQIEQLGQQRQQAFLSGLEDVFAQQREAERERLTGRGLLGAGVENEVLRRLSEEQAGVAARGKGS